MSQQAFAQRAGVSVGCLQGFETARRSTQDKNVVKIAAVLGLTKDQLLAEDQWPPDARHPYAKDLQEEDLLIAHRYHHAGAEYAIKELFNNHKVSDLLRQRAASLLVHLLRTPETLTFFETWREVFEEGQSPPIPNRDKKTS